jgi:phage/plasmid-associated DNA primase
MPFLKGDANTGKGTLCEIVQCMFPRGSVGCITATQECTFGLEAINGKRVVVIPDLPPKFRKLISQSDWQSMVTGENVSVARKNKTAITGTKWTAPFLAAGNYLPDYEDKSGSVSRRHFVFVFENLISERDTNLKNKIIKSEIVPIMLRCITIYR